MPASTAALTTAAVAAASSRPPKLLHPTPTTDTSSDPIRRVSILLPFSYLPVLAQYLPRACFHRYYPRSLPLKQLPCGWPQGTTAGLAPRLCRGWNASPPVP